MSDVFTETTHQGFGSRIKDALIGLVFGLGMFIGAFPLIWWNEGRAIVQAESLNEGASAVVDASTEAVNSANEGKLVHLTGDVRVGEPLAEPDFGFSVSALGLRRKVEMYQWHEKKHSEKRKKFGGGTETVTEYRYEKSWDDDVVNSSSFRETQGHENPDSMPFQKFEANADDARLGAYTLGRGITANLDNWQSYAAPEPQGDLPEGFVQAGPVYYRGNNANSPVIGDVKVSFEQIPEGPFSFVAKQVGSGLAEYQTKAGNPILLIDAGTHPAAEMFKAAQDKNTMLTWLLRAVGFVVMWIGLGLFLRPFATFLDAIPFLGNIAETGIAIFAGLVAFVLASSTIAVAWIAHRPWVTALLVVGVVGALYLLKKRGANSATAAGVPAMAGGPAMSPPPPPGAGLPPPPPR